MMLQIRKIRQLRPKPENFKSPIKLKDCEIP